MAKVTRRDLDEQEQRIVAALVRNPRISDNRLGEENDIPVRTVSRKRSRLAGLATPGRLAGRGRGSAPENVEKVHSEIVSGARYAGGVCRRRAPAPEAPRRPREIAVCRRQLPGPEKRGRARARASRDVPGPWTP